MTLTQFLLARIAEDEAIANETRPDEYIDPEMATDSRDSSAIWCADARVPAFVAITSGRVLAECAVKREIIKSGGLAPDAVDRWLGHSHEWPLKDQLDVPQRVIIYALVLSNLALPYSDHPDYEETWRPSSLSRA